MVLEQSRSGELQRLSANLQRIRGLSNPVEELGLPHTALATISDQAAMESVRSQLRQMQQHYCPKRKLHYLMGAIASVVGNSSGGSGGDRSRTASQASVVGNGGGVVKTPGSTPLLVERKLNGNAERAPNSTQPPTADELIRWLVYLIARCSLINCELEAW